MKLCQTTADLQEEVALAKAAGKSIGLVPTMGDYKVKDIQQSFVYAVAGKRFFLHGLPFSDGCYIIICSCFDILLSSQLKVKLRILKYTNCFMEDA